MGKKKNREPRPFDISRYAQRHVALRLAYVGWKYHGLAVQRDVEDTVEEHLYRALERTRLIGDRETCGLVKAGRTDAGVSALGNVVSLRVRSACAGGRGVTPPAAKNDSGKEGDEANQSSADDLSSEIDYCYVLNRALPDDIRILAWAPVDPEFSARFSCKHRTYRYFFDASGMDIEAIREAAGHFIGEHDFRNFCKIDPDLSHYRRRVMTIEVENSPSIAGASVGCFVINGTAFLWHQIRCMVAVLQLVGRGLEQPDVVKALLDVETIPERPSYAMAPEHYLVLYDCAYDDTDCKFTASLRAAAQCANHTSTMLTDLILKVHLVSSMVSGARTLVPVLGEHAVPQSSHEPLLARRRTAPIEALRAAREAKKRRREDDENMSRE